MTVCTCLWKCDFRIANYCVFRFFYYCFCLLVYVFFCKLYVCPRMLVVLKTAKRCRKAVSKLPGQSYSLVQDQFCLPLLRCNDVRHAAKG